MNTINYVPLDMNKLIRDLRSGKSVKCTECDEGELVPLNDALPEEATTFICNKCGSQLIMN